MRHPFRQSRALLLALAGLLGEAIPTTASAQIISRFVDHVTTTAPRTIHTRAEFEYYPASLKGDPQSGMPVIRFDLNFIEHDDDERRVGAVYYHSTWGNAFGYGGDGIILAEEFITAGVSYRLHEKVETSLIWEPIGLYVNPTRGLFGSGMTAQIAVPLVLIEVNERAQGMGVGFLTQREQNMRVRNVKVRMNVMPGIYLTFAKQGIGLIDGGVSSFAIGIGL